MLEDRGFEVPAVGAATAKARFLESQPIHTGEARDGRRVVLYIDSEERTGIKRVRQLMEQHPDDIVVVSIDGVTPFTKKEVAHEARITFFVAKEVMHNLPRHCLVPRHTALSQEEAEAVKKRFHMMDHHWMLLLSSDPVARWYNWRIGTIVRIERTGLTQDTHVVYRKVVRAATG
tara:strand:- start:779 stop:1303 length:525 start_codon:yes stop_codon:yes gene_type:complete